MLSSVIGTFDRAFSQAIARTNAEGISSIYTLLQTAVVHQETTNPQVSQHARKIQTICNFADLGWVFFGMKQIADTLHKNYDITIFRSLEARWTGRHYFNFMSGTLGMAAALYLTAYVATSYLNKLFQPYKDPSLLLETVTTAAQKTKGITIEFERPESQLWAQQLFVTRIVINCALACLSPNRALPLLNLLAQTYSLVKLSQLKWLNFSRIFRYIPQVTQPRIDWVKVSYRALMTPNSYPKTDEICGYCRNDEKKPDSYFCSYHPIDDACLVEIVNTRSDFFGNGASYIRTDTRNQYGVMSYSYDVELNEENLPNCLHQCVEKYPDHAYFDVLVHDVDKGSIQANVSLKNQQFKPTPMLPRFFEGLNLVYNIFQTSLSFLLQRHPELTSRILTTQRVLLLTDTLALARDYIQLHDHLKKRAKTSETTSRTQKVLGYLKIIAPSLLLAAGGVFLINRALKSSSDLKAILKNVASLSPKDLESVKVNWNTPRIHQFSQILTLSRICVNLFSAYLVSSRKSLSHLTTATLQALTLYKSTQLPWFKLEKTFTRPDAPIWSSSGEQEYLDTVTVESHFLPTSDDLPSTLKSAYDYCTNFFNNSSFWYGYWHISETMGIEIGRNLIYDVKVRPDPIKGDTAPYINRITAWALDSVNGIARINFK